ncbi:MAG TPA: ATP-binding protein, partial [Gemmatimonadaceae bacterium]
VTNPNDTLSTIILWDARGGVHAALRGPPRPEDAAAGLAQARATSETPEATVGPFTARGDSVYFWITVPVREANRAIGYVGIHRRLAVAANSDRETRELIGRDMRLYIANRDSGLWATFAGVPFRGPAGVVDGASHTAYEAPGGERWLAAPAVIPGVPWSIVVAQPYAAIFARPRAILQRLLVVAAVLVLVGAVALWLLSRRLTRPLVALTTAAEAVAAGDYSIRVPARRNDEIGRLSAAFNEMATRVEEATERTARAAERTERLQSVTAALSGAVTPDAVARVVVEQGIASLEARAGAIYALDEGAHELELLRAVGYDDGALAGWRRVPLDDGAAVAAVVRSGTPRFVATRDELGTDPRTGRPYALIADSPSWAALPLVIDGRVLGALKLSFAQPGGFSAEERSFMIALAQQCAQALDRSRLYAAERRARADAEAARRTAEVANRAKSDFLAVMSHEIRTPINAILGYTELLELGLSGPLTPEQQAQLARLRASGRHLLGLVDEILDLAKIEAGQLAVSRSTVRVAETVEAALALVRPQAAARQITLSTRPDAPADAAYVGDPQRAQQVLVNLLSNAVKFTEPGGRVTVGWNHEAGAAVAGAPATTGVWSCIEVEDTGIGIAADQQQAIFEAFMQADQGRTRTRGGTGLGLAISRHLARLMGGELGVRSQLGEGSCFTLRLPAAAVPSAAPEIDAVR